MNASARSLRVLLAEEDQEFLLLIKEMLHETMVDLKITVAENGQKALEILSRTSGDMDNSIDFVILDRVLPVVNGLDVLSYMKSMHGLKRIPVVVMATTYNDEDERIARSIGAANYLVKPSGNEEFRSITNWMGDALRQRREAAMGKYSPRA
jgi:CheY-like chemotaxis protein